MTTELKAQDNPADAQYATSLEDGTVEFHQSLQRHPGIESAIGALQRGNGLKRCREDRKSVV